MVAEIEKKQLKELREIGDGIDALKAQTTRTASFLRGIYHGAGAVVGGVIALALLGWLLGILGVIPGFSTFEEYLAGIVREMHR